MNLLIFIFGKKILKLFSFFIKIILTLKGFKIGKNFYIEAIPKLKLKSTKVDIVLDLKKTSTSKGLVSCSANNNNVLYCPSV